MWYSGCTTCLCSFGKNPLQCGRLETSVQLSSRLGQLTAQVHDGVVVPWPVRFMHQPPELAQQKLRCRCRPRTSFSGQLVPNKYHLCWCYHVCWCTRPSLQSYLQASLHDPLLQLFIQVVQRRIEIARKLDQLVALLPALLLHLLLDVR